MTQPESIQSPHGYVPLGAAAKDAQGTTYVLVRSAANDYGLLVRGEAPTFTGETHPEGTLCPLTAENAAALAGRFAWLRPRRAPADRVSFGFGDRLGLASPGHLRSLAGTRVFPILAQQSVRENTRTGRSFAAVLGDAVFGAFREGYREGFGADADHLKEIDDALEAAALGYSFFTCDPGEHVINLNAMTDTEITAQFAAQPDAADLADRYAEQSFVIGDRFVLTFSREDLERTVVKYGGAVQHAVRMYEALRDVRPGGFDYEVSVDETESPTSPLEHLFVALELRRRGVDFVSLAPRFVGAMEKGVDWRGDRERFDADLRQHAEIARSAGNYRLSLHSGSDKFSLYPAIVRQTRGRCHVKTAGTSYLVALDVIARHDPAFFRRVVRRSFKAFSVDRATYHISADPSKVPPIDSFASDDLSTLVWSHDARQMLHVSFGSILAGPLYAGFRSRLIEREEEHFAGLAQHLRRHLDGLEVTKDE